MPRDPNKLQVFRDAHELVLSTYRLTSGFPADETYGLQAQLRRAGVSIGANLAEGSARHEPGDYRRFVDIALGSAVELRYLFDLAADLGLLAGTDAEDCRNRSDHVVRALLNLRHAIARFGQK